VMLPVAAILRSAVGQYSQQPDIFRLKERHHPVVQQIGCNKCVLAVIELYERNP
jgi:hypothetical protein